MKKFSEEELSKLKKLTDEIFVISNNPQLPVVQKMKKIDCYVMNTGLRKINMDYFFCKTCDKEHKFPICKQCAEKCHKGHLIPDYVQGSDDHPAICMCGFKCHNMGKKEKEVDSEQNSIKCCFNLLSILAEQYEYYVGVNGKKVCIFCYHFCCHSLLTNEDDDESRERAFRKYQFRKVSCSKEEFELGVSKGEITCDCLSLNDSKHKSPDYLSVFINDLNIPSYDEEDSDDYFSHLTPTHIINLFFTSNELFESIYTGFISEYNDFMNLVGDKLDKAIISTTFGIGYANFANNSTNCKYNFYFNEKINIYFTTKMTKSLLEKNMKMTEQNNTFLINYIKGYIKFRLGSYFECLPRYLISDELNLSPLQRKIFRDKSYKIFFTSGLSKENLIDTVVTTIERIVRVRPDITESIQVFIELFRIIKFYARYFLMTKEEICKICKIVEDFFAYLALFRSSVENDEIYLKEERAKLLKTIIKCITYFTIYINDETYCSFFNLDNAFEEHENEKIFFQSFTEVSKLINKIMIHTADYLRQEFEVVSILIQKENDGKLVKKLSNSNSQNSDDENDEDDEMTNEEYQISLMRIIFIIQITLDFVLSEKDTYLPSMRRAINTNLVSFLKIIPESNEKDFPFLKMINEDTNTLEGFYADYFNASNIKIDILEEFLKNMINRALNPLDNKFENIVDKSYGVFTSEYDYQYKNLQNAIVNNNTSQFQFNKSTILYSITKIFRLSKDKSIYSAELCENVIRFCYAFINENQDNCIIGLSTPILKNLSKIPRQYLCCVLDYMIFGLKILIKFGAEIPNGFLFAKFGFLIYHKSSENSKQNNGQNLSNSPYCLVKLFKLLELMFLLKTNDQHQFLDYIKPHLEDITDSDLIQKYKLYLIEIADDFKNHSKSYFTKRNFNNPDIFQKYYQNYIALSPSFGPQLMFKIFNRYFKLITKTFDLNALDEMPPFLSEFLSADDLIHILSITTLNISLRLELIKFFRMIYIDLSIDLTRLEQYRYNFQQELDADVAEVGDSLIPIEQMKIFLFLQRLLKVSNYNFYSQESQKEFDLILFEVKNIKKIIMGAKKAETSLYMKYIENAIILPIKIYLNKALSMIMSIKGEGLLKLYKFCYYLLKMKEFVIESKIISNVPEEEHFESVFKNEEFGNEKSLQEVKEDIELITNSSFTILNYMEIYKIINKHVMSLIEEPTSQELVLYFSEYEKFEENTKLTFKSELTKKGINFSKSSYKTAWEAYEIYIEQKGKFEKSSIKSNFEDNFLDGETSVRSVLMKYLFFISTNKAGCFSPEGINMLLKLLKFETDESQEAILALAEKTIKGNNKKNVTLNKQNDNQLNSYKKRQIEDFLYLATKGFDNILSSIFSQYNPTSIVISDEYYTACHIIKVFKFLCEDHNQNFQHRLMCEISFTIGNGQNVNFYDMMLFIVDKIITISSWENSKYNTEVQDYFYGLFSCLIEMLIEIVQGSEPNNFKVLYNQGDNEVESDDENDNKKNNPEPEKERKTTLRRNSNPLIFENKTFENGKALKTFLNNIKSLMFDDFSDSDVIFSVRKDLMDFVLAFMEEYNCPKNIKNLIMSCYHPSMIIKSICNVLKKFYLKQITLTQGKSIFIDEENFKRNRTNRIIDQNLDSTKQNLKPKNKKLKQLKFNEELCSEFTQLYFEDPNFSQTKTFDLCNVFFKYFILTYIQYKNEETTDFWNRVHNVSDEVLFAYNKRTKISNKLDGLVGSINDESDLEAYYVIKFFNEVSKHVLVKMKPEVPPIYVVYTIHPYSKYLSSDSKSEFLRNVDRKNRYTKLYDLIESSEYFMLEIVYNWTYLRKNQLLRKSTNINYHVLGYITFLVSLILNFILLVCLHESGEEYYGTNVINSVKIISYIICGLVLVIIVFWCATKYQLYYEIEKAKYKAHHNDKHDIPDEKLTFYDKIKIRYQAIFGKGELNPFIFFFIFTLLGIIRKELMFFFSFSLLAVVSLSQTLNNIILSIVVKGQQLLWTSLFAMVLLYVYAGWGYYYQRDRYYDTDGRETPEEMCKSLLYCFLTQINNGLRWHPGVGKVVRSESAIKHLWAFIHRFIHDLLFFWLLEAMMLHIIYGIIIDSFGELRQAHYLIEKDIANNCFICNVEKDECEKNNKSFKEHCENVHNIWDYAFYMITLRMADPQNLNSVNSKNRERMFEKGVDWLPDCTVDKLDDNEDDEKE